MASKGTKAAQTGSTEGAETVGEWKAIPDHSKPSLKIKPIKQLGDTSEHVTWKTIDAAIADIVTTTNARQDTNGPELDDLKKSMAVNGQLVPVVLAETRQDSGAKYQLVAGHRRLAAAKALGWTTIRAQVPDKGDVPATWSAEVQAIENIERLQLSALEEAFAATDLVERFENSVAHEYARDDGRIDAEAAGKMRGRAIRHASERLGKSMKWVEDKTFIMQLPLVVRNLLHEGKLPLSHAREIAKVADPEEATRIAEKVKMGHKQGDWDKKPDPDRPAKSIDDVRSLVARTCSSLKDVPWKLDFPFAGKPACSTCPQNAANAAGLFGGMMFEPKGYRDPTEKPLPPTGLCTNLTCYKEKTKACNQAASAAARAAIQTQEKRAAVTVNGKPPKLPKDFVPKATPAAVAQFVPDFVEPKTVVAKAKEAVERRTEKKKPAAKTAAKVEPSAKEKEKELLRESIKKWKHAAEVWAPPYAKQVGVLLDKNPILDLKIQIVNHLFEGGDLDLTANPWSYKAPTPPSVELSATHKVLVGLACDPTAQGLNELLIELRKDDPDWDIHCSRGIQLEGVLCTVAAPLVLSALGIETDKPFPRWSDFVETATKPKVLPVHKLPEDAAAKKPAKKAAKKGGRS